MKFKRKDRRGRAKKLEQVKARRQHLIEDLLEPGENPDEVLFKDNGCSITRLSLYKAIGSVQDQTFQLAPGQLFVFDASGEPHVISENLHPLKTEKGTFRVLNLHGALVDLPQKVVAISTTLINDRLEEAIKRVPAWFEGLPISEEPMSPDVERRTIHFSEEFSDALERAIPIQEVWNNDPSGLSVIDFEAVLKASETATPNPPPQIEQGAARSIYDGLRAVAS